MPLLAISSVYKPHPLLACGNMGMTDLDFFGLMLILFAWPVGLVLGIINLLLLVSLAFRARANPSLRLGLCNNLYRWTGTLVSIPLPFFYGWLLQKRHTDVILFMLVALPPILFLAHFIALLRLAARRRSDPEADPG